MTTLLTALKDAREMLIWATGGWDETGALKAEDYQAARQALRRAVADIDAVIADHEARV